MTIILALGFFANNRPARSRPEKPSRNPERSNHSLADEDESSGAPTDSDILVFSGSLSPWERVGVRVVARRVVSIEAGLQAYR
jgi:hypothetical protein